MKIKYTAWIPSIVNKQEEDIELDERIKSVADLINWLCQRDHLYKEAFKNQNVIFAAKNLKACSFNETISNDDEITFFAPIAGG